MVADIKKVWETNSDVFQRSELGQGAEPFIVGLIGARDGERQVMAAGVEPERLQCVLAAGQGVVEGGRLVPLGVEVRIRVLVFECFERRAGSDQALHALRAVAGIERNLRDG